ncbi:MAG TPA: BamA/TamA family outer membrane protein, partial [Thermoanaerobaculia bacterium]|nr:BamA/TamA family outer membrane protein [Thermoanaerobaculia bacterium]
TRGDNELAILDVGRRRIERQIDIPEAGQLWNPAWSPDGRSIAISGSVGGLTDLFLVDLESGRSRRLTSDSFADLQPEWSPDGRTLAFVSDRGAESAAETTYSDFGIWALEVGSGQIRRLVPAAEGLQYNPKFGPGGRDLYFLSDRAGVSDVYRLSLASGELFRVTRVATGIAGISRLSPALSVSERTGLILLSVFTDDRQQIHALDPQAAQGERVVAAPDEAAEARASLLPPQQPAGRAIVSEYLSDQSLPALPGEEPAEVVEYRPRLSLDFIGPSVGVGFSTFGTSYGGDITAYFSDELGEREIGFSLIGQTGELDEFGGQAYYLDQSSRLQWGGAVAHLPYITGFTNVFNDVVEIDGQQVPATVVEQVRQTLTEDRASFITRYPFSTTQRLEASVGVSYIGFENELLTAVIVGDTVVDRSERGLAAPESLQLYQGSLAYVGDNSYYGFTAPVRGRRYRFEVEPTFGDLEFQSVTADYRRYLFFRPVTLAMRGLHFGRYGRDAESSRLSQLYVGRPTLVRGYEFDDIGFSECTPIEGNENACPEFDRLVGSRLAVANLELRFPLVGIEGYGIFRTRFLPIDMNLFVDAGAAWTDDTSVDWRFDRATTDRVPVVSAGVSARVLLGGFAVLEFYYAKPFQRPNEDWVTGFLIAPGW